MIIADHMRSLHYFTARLGDYLDELQALTAIETPTGDSSRLELAGDFLAERFAPFGQLDREQLPGYGPLLRLVREGTGARVLLLAHFDTVWPVGSWPTLWRIDGGRAFGPGVYDMKGGLLFILNLLRFLEAEGLPHPHLEVLLTPDEEIGSPGSRDRIEAAARRADFVLVLEPTNLEGNLKLARKGSAEYVVRISGLASHQGVAPEKGINAVVEAAHQVLRLLELQDLEAGTTVGPNVIAGGSASNMVPDRAEIRVDVRAWTAAEAARLDTAIQSLRPQVPGTEIVIDGGWNRPPMTVSPAAIELFERTRELGRELGLDLEWVRWGGSSDANLTAAVGAPTMDGLGPIGEGAHQIDEHIVIDEVPTRLALFTELVISLAGSHKAVSRET